MKYSIGIDFGTLSARAVLVNLQTGEEEYTYVFEYPNGVISEFLGDIKLSDNFALQNPQDYIDALCAVIKGVISESGVNTEDIVGVGIDFTSCTILPVKEDGTPLCFFEKYKNRPHSYAKLWKHHGAQSQADKFNEVAQRTNQSWLKKYGGKISSEWMFPKILEILECDEEVYNETDRFIEAGDWLIWRVTGKETHSACMAGFKGFWSKKEGYPSAEFFGEVNSRMKNIIGSKVAENVLSMGEIAGFINEEGEKLTGLKKGTPVATACIDAHAGLPACGITKEGEMLLIIGTSGCQIMLDKKEHDVEGICGYVEDGLLSGYYAYEAGQVCVGDHFDWFCNNLVPERYEKEAREKNVNIHKLLREKAKKLKVGESGLLALDFWNGNRSVLVDANLSGMIMGMNLNTKPEEIYRALLEAVAFGTRVIIETFENSGVEINSFCAAGGIAQKDELLMQIYADVLGKEIKISGSSQAGALGSAMFGAVAGGYFKDMDECSKVLAKVKDVSYKPINENKKIYDEIYKIYKELYYYFGKDNNCMKRLEKIKEL